MSCQLAHILLREGNTRSGGVHFAASQMSNVLAVEGWVGPQCGALRDWKVSYTEIK